MLQDLKMASARTVGMKQTLKAIQGGNAHCVYLAKDVEDYVAAKIKGLCGKAQVELLLVDTMKDLGEACGIQVGAATAAILK